MNTYEKGFFDFLLGYRKTLAWFSLFTVSIVFRLYGYIDGGQFVDLMKSTFLGFIAGNLGEHLGNLGQSYLKSKINIPAIVDSIKKEI